MLAPGRHQTTGSIRRNDDCLVFTATFAATTALLEGDAERPGGTARCGAAPGGDAAEGRASWKRERNFLRSACDRSSALCGHFRRARNVYGHPRREVLERLQQAEVTTYRTDEEGAVSFYLDGKSVTPDVALIH